MPPEPNTLGMVLVHEDDLRTVLNQRNLHAHRVPGRWDDNGRACAECAARARLQVVLAIGGRHAGEKTGEGA